MPQKVLITGATGLLGRQVATAFKRSGWTTICTGFTRSTAEIRKLDINDDSAIQHILDKESPITDTNTGAAERSPDKVSADPEAAKKLNVRATESLAKACGSRGILIIYVSTDYVFSGKQGEAPYEADALAAPTNLYGKTKLDGETATMRAAADLGVILRVPVLYGAADKNSDSAINTLVDSVWKAQEKDVRIPMDDWAQRYPTNTEDVGRVIKDVAEKYTSSDLNGLPRILQFTSEDRCTKYEICEIFADILGLSFQCIESNKAGNDPSSATQRPYDTHLSTIALKGIGIPIWTQSFKDWWKRELNAVRQ